MTAATDNRYVEQRGLGPISGMIDAPVKAAATIFAGTIGAIDLSGNAMPAGLVSGGSVKCLGVAVRKVDNSAGAAGDVRCTFRRGIFPMNNSATTDAITAADVGRPVYVVDDNTVARTNASGTRICAGRLFGMDGTTPLVEFGSFEENSVIDLLIPAAADLSAAQYLLMALGSGGTVNTCSAAGQQALGVLQNAPASGAIAIVRARGISRVIASATIATGVNLATTSAGKTKAAVAGKTDTSDAGAANDPLIGSFVMGIALTDGATDTAHQMLVAPMGAIPGTAA